MKERNYKKVREKRWPFEVDEEVKLYWLSDPYKKKSKVIFNAYFMNTLSKEIKKVELDWGMNHFLAIGRYYKNRDLNNSYTKADTQCIDICFEDVRFDFKENKKEIRCVDKMYTEFIRFFECRMDGYTYRLPINEILRAVLAPKRFLLNRIVELNSLYLYLNHKVKGKNFYIEFFNSCGEEVLKEDSVKYISWLLINKDVFKVFNQVGQNFILMRG